MSPWLLGQGDIRYIAIVNLFCCSYHIIIIVVVVINKTSGGKKCVFCFYFFFAADLKVPETVCLFGLNPTGVKLTTGNYWFPISAFKKKKEKKSSPFLQQHLWSVSVPRTGRIVCHGRFTSVRRVITYGSAHRPLVIQISKIHSSQGTALTRRAAPLWEEDRAANHPQSWPECLHTPLPLSSLVNLSVLLLTVDASTPRTRRPLRFSAQLWKFSASGSIRL